MVYGLVPSSALPGERIVILGTDLTDADGPLVTFDGVSASVIAASAMALEVQVPVGLPGRAVWLRVRTWAGDAAPVPFTNLAGRLYVRSAGALAVYEQRDLALVERVALPDGEGGLALSPDGRLLALNCFWESRVLVLEAATLETLADLQVGPGPLEPRFSPDGELLLIPVFEADRLLVLDARPSSSSWLAPLASIPTGAGPYGLIPSVGGERLFVTNLRDGSLTVVGLDPWAADYLTASATVYLPYGRPATGLADERGLLVANQKHAASLSLVDIDPASPGFLDMTTDIPVRGWPSQLLWSADHERVYVTVFDPARDSSYLTRYDWGTRRLAALRLELLKGSSQPLLAPATGELVVASAPSWEYQDDRLFVVDLRGAGEDAESIVAELPLPGVAEDAVMLADGRRLAAAASNDESLLVIDIPSRTVLQRLSLGGWALAVAVSP